VITIDERFIVLLLTTCANLFLGIVVWRKNPKQQINQRFGLICVTVAAWSLSNGLVNAYAASPLGVIWARAAFFSASAIPLSFLLFVLVFPAPTAIPSPGLTRAVLVCGLIVCGISATPLIAQRTESVAGALHVIYGPLHLAFATYFTAACAYTLALLYRKLMKLTGIERLQVRYFFLGVSLAIVGGSITNLFIPLGFQTSRFSAVGPLFTIVMVSVIAHAIIRYRLMNIRLAMRRGLVYLLAIVTVSLTFLAAFWIGSRLLSSRPQLPLWIELFIVLAIAVLFHPLKDLVQRWADRYFFTEPYDYQRVVRDISKNMATILDLKSLFEYTCDAITKTVHAEYVAAYAKSLAGTMYEPLVVRHAVAGVPSFAPMNSDSSLPVYLSKTRQPLLVDELSSASPTSDVHGLRQELRFSRAEIALPIHDVDSLSGFLLLGPKLSADPYFAEDIDLLMTLTSQAAIATQNARLYSQVVLANDYVENILGTIDHAVIAVDRAGRITRFNSAAARLTGAPAAALKGTSIQQLPPTIARLLNATASDGRPQTQFETTVPDPSGRRLVPVICSTSPLRDPNGSVLGAVAVISDLTGLKRLEEEKRQVERLASIGALASGIAHEIKNPLVAIRTFAELLPERFSDEEFRDDFSRVALREIERIDDLVARLRGLVMPSKQSPTSLDVRTPLKETVALLRGQLEQARISLQLELDEDPPHIAGNFVQLKQLFLNLLVNALEATATGGRLAIRVRNHSTRAGDLVVVEIADSGSGISDDLLTKIFEPFVTTKQHGSGLGLSICRGIADAHRATIRARNNSPGQGATITVEFPALKLDRDSSPPGGHAAVQLSSAPVVAPPPRG
jgi:PAS domain S-box-containing protein